MWPRPREVLSGRGAFQPTPYVMLHVMLHVDGTCPPVPQCPYTSAALPLRPLVLAAHSARHCARPRDMAESRVEGSPHHLPVEFRPWKAGTGINQTELRDLRPEAATLPGPLPGTPTLLQPLVFFTC